MCSQGPPVLRGSCCLSAHGDVLLQSPCSPGCDRFLEVLLGTANVCRFFFPPPFFSFFSLLGFVSWLQESCVLSKTALSVKVPCFCKAIWTGSLQIPRAQAWLPACPCRAPVPEMDLSPFPPSAFLPF